MFKLAEGSKVYVICPAGCFTGGPEAIHQFVHKARELGIDANIVYSRMAGGYDGKWQGKHFVGEHRNKPAGYHMYNTTSEERVVDDAKNVLIVPEIAPSYLPQFEHIQKAIWWLAWRGNVAEMIAKPEYVGVAHLWQSTHAELGLIESDAKIMGELRDYISDFYTQCVIDYSAKEDIVVFNPAKGGPATQAIKEVCAGVRFEPIEKMTQSEVRDLLLKSKVYIDFGPHHGKDRIPREAVLCGCSIVVRDVRAARTDIPGISYKYPGGDEFNPTSIAETIKHLLGFDKLNFLNHFGEYQIDILREEIGFEHQIRCLFNV